MIDEIMSSLAKSPTSDFVYSSLSFFGGPRGGPLTGVWFVRSMGALGVSAQTTRQTLFRMEAEGALIGRKVGRTKRYHASPTTLAVIEAGRDRVAQPANERWDGRWTLVHFRVGEDDRDIRDRLRDVLLVEGFGSLGPGLYIHPRDRTARLTRAAKELRVTDRINVFRGAHSAGVSDQQLVHETWDLAAIAARYRTFIRRFTPVAAARTSTLTPLEAFGLRFAFMFEFFRISWDDPSLPHELLPAEWPGEEARRLAETLMKKLMPGALRFGKGVARSESGAAS